MMNIKLDKLAEDKFYAKCIRKRYVQLPFYVTNRCSILKEDYPSFFKKDNYKFKKGIISCIANSKNIVDDACELLLRKYFSLYVISNISELTTSFNYMSSSKSSSQTFSPSGVINNKETEEEIKRKDEYLEFTNEIKRDKTEPFIFSCKNMNILRISSARIGNDLRYSY